MPYKAKAEPADYPERDSIRHPWEYWQAQQAAILREKIGSNLFNLLTTRLNERIASTRINEHK